MLLARHSLPGHVFTRKRLQWYGVPLVSNSNRRSAVYGVEKFGQPLAVVARSLPDNVGMGRWSVARLLPLCPIRLRTAHLLPALS